MAIEVSQTCQDSTATDVVGTEFKRIETEEVDVVANLPVGVDGTEFKKMETEEVDVVANLPGDVDEPDFMKMETEKFPVGALRHNTDKLQGFAREPSSSTSFSQSASLKWSKAFVK